MNEVSIERTSLFSVATATGSTGELRAGGIAKDQNPNATNVLLVAAVVLISTTWERVC